MEKTANLKLPYIMPSQAQKHVTHNDALAMLDALVQISALTRSLGDPPASPQEGDRFIVAAAPSGAWAGRADALAAWNDGAWGLFDPRPGWIAWIEDEEQFLAFDGDAWSPIAAGGGGDVNPTPLVGVNATADTSNRLAVSSPAVLLNHEGAGHQLKINKAEATDTASLLFQTGFSGRAEMGTAGSDDFQFKVSPDGSVWHEAIAIDRATGAVSFPNTALGSEEGTWTPAFTFGTPGNLSVSYANQLGRYIRIGNLLHLWCRLDFTPTHSTASGNSQITGLPFTIDSLDGGVIIGHVSGAAYPGARTFPIVRGDGTPSTLLNILAFGPSLGSAALGTTQLPSGTAQQFIFSIVASIVS